MAKTVLGDLNFLKSQFFARSGKDANAKDTVSLIEALVRLNDQVLKLQKRVEELEKK